MPSIGPMELVVVLIIALVVLGPKRLPDAGRSIGKGMREFKDAISGDNDKQEIGAFAQAAQAAQASPAMPHAVATAPVPAEAPVAQQPTA